MVQVELDEISEGTLREQARERGMNAGELVAEFVRSGLKTALEQTTPETIEKRKRAIQRITDSSKGRTLGLKELGLTMREFIQAGHKY